jgi:hypothetical protein
MKDLKIKEQIRWGYGEYKKGKTVPRVSFFPKSKQSFMGASPPSNNENC